MRKDKQKGSPPKKDSQWEIPQQKNSRKTKNKMGVCCSEGRIIDASNTRMGEERRWG
jgi:hypothetical protein